MAGLADCGCDWPLSAANLCPLPPPDCLWPALWRADPLGHQSPPPGARAEPPSLPNAGSGPCHDWTGSPHLPAVDLAGNGPRFLHPSGQEVDMLQLFCGCHVMLSHVLRFCANEQWIKLNTTPLFSLMRAAGTVVGVASMIALRPLPQTEHPLAGLLISVLLIGCLEMVPIATEITLFYIQSLCVCAVVPVTVGIVHFLIVR